MRDKLFTIPNIKALARYYVSLRDNRDYFKPKEINESFLNAERVGLFNAWKEKVNNLLLLICLMLNVTLTDIQVELEKNLEEIAR